LLSVSLGVSRSSLSTLSTFSFIVWREKVG